MSSVSVTELRWERYNSGARRGLPVLDSGQARMLCLSNMWGNLPLFSGLAGVVWFRPALPQL